MSEEPKPPRRAAIAFIFITILLDMFALGMVIPVLPKLVERMLDGNTAAAARIYGLMAAVWALMQFFSMPVLGALSDRFGRRPVILASNLGLGLSYVVMALAPSLAWLFAARSISGVMAASVSTAQAYVADVTTPEKRAASMGLLGIAFGLGFILGPAIGGLLGHYDPRLPFWAAGACSLLNAAYGWFVLPESLPRDRRSEFKWRRANPVGSLKLLRSHPELFGLAGVLFMSNLAHLALNSTFVLYGSYRYGWTERDVGLVLALIGFSAAIVQGGLTGRVVHRFGERRVLIAGLVAGALGFAIYAFAPTGHWFMVGVPLVALWGLAGPAGLGLMTRRVSPQEQGQLQGANGSLLGISAMIGPALFAATFAAFIGPSPPLQLHFPGAAFLLAAAMLAFAAWFTAVTVPGLQVRVSE